MVLAPHMAKHINNVGWVLLHVYLLICSRAVGLPDIFPLDLAVLLLLLVALEQGLEGSRHQPLLKEMASL